MPAFDAASLAAWSGGRWGVRRPGAVLGFTCDSRALRPGQIFVALRTDKRDGHDFLPAAEAAGAAGALVASRRRGLKLPQLAVPDPLAAFQRIAREHRRRFSGKVIGVTGSAGKTSTKDLLALLLGGSASAEAGEDASPVLATRGNLNNHLGVPLTLTRIDPARHRFAVIEAGISAPGEMATLAAMIEPDLAIVTLVAPAHLDGLGGLEGVAAEKAALAAAVRPGGRAFFPAECAEHAPFRALGAATILEPSDGALAAPAGRLGYSVSHRGAATAVSLGGRLFELPRVSDGMARNAALALAAALELGADPEQLRARLARWRPAPLRGEWREAGERLFYLDCYNANPASMLDALGAFCGSAPEALPRLFVLGGMEELGAEAERHHRALGRAVRLRPDDCLIAVGGHAPAVVAGALEAGNPPARIEAAETAEAAAGRVASFRGAIFVKGSRRYALEQLAPRGEELAHA